MKPTLYFLLEPSLSTWGESVTIELDPRTWDETFGITVCSSHHQIKLQIPFQLS